MVEMKKSGKSVNILRKSNSAGPGLFQAIDIEHKREKTSSNVVWSASKPTLNNEEVAACVL
jgi:hypothetical protein